MSRPFFSLISIFMVFTFMACQQRSSSNQQTSNTPTVAEGKICIKKVMEADNHLGRIRNHACEKISLSATIKDYVAGMEKIDFQDCPASFSTAFKRHQQAWSDMLVVTDHYPDLRGEMHDLFDILEKEKDADQFKALLKQIWDTWAEVETAMKE